MSALQAYPIYALVVAATSATLAALAVTLGALAVIGPSLLASHHRFPISAGLSAVALEFLSIWLQFGVVCLAAAIIYLSATAWGRYVTAAVVAAVTPRSRLPVRLGRFLDWACAAGLLRQSGAVYQFRHQELQEWLRKELRPSSDT